MTAIEVSCTHVYLNEFNCAAQQGEPCKFFGLEKGMTGFHAERIALAASVTPTGDGYRPDAKAFDDAVAEELF